MKPILPTLKERKRYILFELYSKIELEKRIVNQQVTKACLQFLGEIGMAKSGVQFLPETYDKKTGRGIIRANHRYVDEVKSALALIKEVKGYKVSFNAIKVSGILNKVKSKE